MIEEVHPYTADGFLRPATAAETWGESPEGVYKVTDVPLLKSMPIWKWVDTLSFAKTCERATATGDTALGKAKVPWKLHSGVCRAAEAWYLELDRR